MSVVGAVEATASADGIAVLVVADRSAPGCYGQRRRHEHRDELAMTGTAAFDRITFEPGKMGGRACIRGMRITVSTIVGLVAEGETTAAILATWPDLEPEDVLPALAYAAWLTREEVMPA